MKIKLTVEAEAECCHKSKKHVHFGYRIGEPQPKHRRKEMLDIEITNEQKIKVTLNPVTESGNPAELDGKPEWSVLSGGNEDPSKNLQVSEDGLSAYLISNDTPGDIEFLIKADADRGAGFEEISDVIRVHVSGAKAKSLGLVKGEPEPK